VVVALLEMRVLGRTSIAVSNLATLFFCAIDAIEKQPGLKEFNGSRFWKACPIFF
jgi:hypothetical protein